MRSGPTFATLLAYDHWANVEAADAVAAADAAAEKPRSILAHIVGVEWMWYCRVVGAERRMAIWPDVDPATCRREFDELQRVWHELIEARAPSGLERPVRYVNSQGESWTNTVGDILTHVILHSIYHRGQIATELRRAGAEPPYTDFIHAVRQGLLPES